MTEFTPIPERLSLALPLRARRILEQTRVRSCEELLALGHPGKLRIANCGPKTLDALQRLQSRVLKQYPGLRPHYTEPLALAPREPVKPLVKKSPQRTKPTNDPPPTCGPADWSILNRSLSDLFQLPPLPPDEAPVSEATIATLGLPAAELERLRAIALFPEDPIHFLGSLSLGYLSQAGLGDTVFSVIHEALARCHGLGGPALPSLASAQVPDTPLYAGIAPDLLDSLAVLDFTCSILLEAGTGCRPPTVPFSTLAKITERTVIERLGLCSEALRDIGNLWLLQQRAASLQWSARAGLPSHAYGDFYRLADAYLDLALGTTSSKRYIDPYRRMLKGRLRLADGRKWTLRELGKSEGVTHQRVRQVEWQIMQVLKRPELLQHLGYLWQLLDHLLVSGGGVRYLSELAGALAETLGWPSAPGEALAAVVELSPNYQVNWDAPIRVVLARNCCARCAAIGAAVTEAVEAAPDGVISFESVLEKAEQSCRNSSCPQLGKIDRFSSSILHCVADTTPGIRVRNEQLVAPQVQLEGSHRRFVEAILMKAGKEMYYTDIQHEHNRMLPDRLLTPKQAYVVLTDSPLSVLWGAGTFIHRDLISLPRPLIAEIVDGIEKRLSSHDIPYLCLNGTIFDHYRDRLSSQCVQTPLALYTCLRLVGSATLDFSEYPYVRRTDGPVPRPALTALLGDFLLDRPRPVSLDEVRQYGMITLGMGQGQMVTHLRRAPGVRQIGTDNFFLHDRHLGPLLDAVTEIIGDRRNSRRATSLSVEWLYHHNLARCHKAGIKSVACLTSLIKHFFPTRNLIRNRPEPRGKRINMAQSSLEKPAQIRCRSSRVSIGKQVENYLANKTGPWKTKELLDHIRKTNPNHRYCSLTNNGNFLWYTKDSMIARQLLGWDPGKQAAMEESAARHLEQRRKNGKPFGMCSELLLKMGSTLPEIGEHLPWTPVLLQQLLGSGKKFIALGWQRDIFIAADNPLVFATLDDLMFHALVNEYGGKAPKKPFIAAMRKSGLAPRKLTKLLTGQDCRIVLDDNFIAVAGRPLSP